MNITKESTGNLTATLKIDIQSTDYAEKVEKQLKDYQRKASMPGFRPGKVPFGMVKKMYEKGTMAETINTLLNESIYAYIEENKLNILGNPLPNEEKSAPADFDSDNKEFSFYFDIALAPEITVELSDKVTFDLYKIEVDKKVLDNYILESQRRFGKFNLQDKVEHEDDLIYGKFEELNDDKTIKENGLSKKGSLAMDKLSTVAQKALLGKAKEEKVILDIKSSLTNEADIAALFGIKKEEIAALSAQIEFTLESISHVDLAELDQELFDKLYKDGSVTSEAELREKIKQEAGSMYVRETETKFMNDVIEYYINNTSIELPKEFLKKWLLATNTKIDKAKLEEDFDKYIDSLKWQLIENKLITDNQIAVTIDEVKEYYKGYVRSQFLQYSMGLEDEGMDERIEEIALNALKDEENTKKIYEKLYDEKIASLIKDKATVVEKTIGMDDFVKLVSKQ